MNRSSLLETIFYGVRAFFIFTTTLALGLYAYVATFARPLGDDYCFSAWNQGVGPLIGGLYKYYTTSNRFSNQFIVYLSDIFGPRGVGWLSLFVMLLWPLALTLLLSEISRALRIRWNLWTAILLAELIALVSYYSAADLFQSVYWRPGLMTYFLPLVLFAFVFIGILRGARMAAGRAALSGSEGHGKVNDGRASLWLITALFFVALFNGGLSETVGALHITILGLALVGVFLWNKGPSRRAALALITSALAGALMAMAFMFRAPANEFRMETGTAPTLAEVLIRTFTFGVQFLLEAARLLKQPALFSLGSGALIGYTCVKFGGVDSPSARKTWLALFIVPLLTYLLIIASFAPSAYGQSYPAGRVRFPAHVLFTIALLLEGGLAGLLFSRINLSRWATALAVLALVLGAVYPLWMIRNNRGLLPEYKTRAAQWDFRDARIRELAASGERDITVWQLPGVGNVKDLDTRAAHWVNYCAAIYYGVDSISAPQGQIPAP